MMFKLICIFVFALAGCNCICNLNEYDPVVCVLQLTASNCLYDEFLNQCIETSNQNLGCSYNLNRNACINQLTISGNIESRCIFQNRCREVNIFHLKNLGCSNSYSKYACVNVINKDCFWNGYQCEDSQKIIFSDYSKDEIYPYSVTPQLCAKYHKSPCMNTGPQGDYKCVALNQIQFKEIKCSTLGLNEIGCVSILTNNEMCLFENDQCKTIKPSEILECSQKLNKLACLSITKPHLLCQWQQNECRVYKFDQQVSCLNIVDVNINVCANQQGFCMFDQLNYKCTELNQNQLEDLNCDTPGITKFACLSIQNQQCTFYQGFCQTLSENDLSNYQCQMQLNQAACINIKTKDQLCLWNGQGCQNVQITQDQDCDSFDQFLVNGNVCQAITKPHAMCKYNEITKICVESSTNDYCSTPYLNLYGCVSISRENQFCKWIDSSCQDILIIPFETVCSSLEYANYLSCQQVFENNQIGCYFDKNKSQCVSLLISTDNENNINLQEIQKANQFLATVSCFDKTLGLNRIICGSIMTENVFCRWQQNSCKFLKKNAITNIPCTDLKYANPQTCAQVKYNNEFCRYFKEEIGCTNQLIGEMNCNDLGLNTISCKKAKENCYFEEDRCQSIGEISTSITPEVQIILEKLQCLSNFPTERICLAIQTPGQLCQWSNKYQQCREVLEPKDKKCSDFSSFKVNPTVCASINLKNKMQFYQDPSYCEYDSQENNCREKNKKCTSKCCTEIEEIGINAYSCIRFSSQDPGVYCYFEDCRCKQLTNQIVDIQNPNHVKSYYNERKFTCAQMNKNSCHMIDWSTSQTCYYNGFACVNLNLQSPFEILELTKSSAIVNVYVCLAIEAVNSSNLSLKYIEYNSAGKNCKFLQQPYPQYQTCESVTGNSNICLGLTSNLYCKWDQEKLKCVTMTLDQSQEILTCNEYQNIKSCIENQYSACQFSLAQDKCINAPLDQDCSYFNSTGKVSRKTCSLISKKGQICEFQNNYCVVSTKSIEGCNLDGINKGGCFKNTKGNCRWDDVSGQCYENKTALQELECNNNLNQILCMKVTKQPCMWNEDQYQCVYFNMMTKDQYVGQNPKNQYNQWACALIVGAGYTFDADNHKCKILDDTQKFGCSDISMNNYACQFLTKGSNCYFDQNEKPPKCKIFNLDQTICSSKYAINIEVCMKIPKPCKFSLKTMSCETLIVNQDTTCLDLQGLQNKGEYANKLGCSLISESLQGNDGEYQCYQNEDLKQMCNYQKFCLWNNYTCKVSIQQILVFDKEQYIISDKYFLEFYNNNCTSNTDCNSIITNPEFNESGITYPGVSQNLKCGLGRCDYTNEPCSSKTDCQDISIENLQVNDDGSIKQPKMQAQTCQSTCQKSLVVQECNLSEIPPKEVLHPASTQNQLCQGRCTHYQNITCVSNTCEYYLKVKATYKYCDNQTAKDDAGTPNRCIQDPAIYEKDQCLLDSFRCSKSSKPCSRDLDCLLIVVQSWLFKEAICKKYNIYTKSEICKGFYYLKLKCQNIFSKALCLEMTNQNCYFDINQGGCIQLEGNEHKVPNCDSVKNTRKPTNQCDNFNNICRFSGQQQNEYQNTCQEVSSQKMKCEDGSEQNVADDSCPSNTRSYINCVKSLNIQNLDCLRVPNPSILNCAAVADYCRYSNGVCVSDQNIYPCLCDRSFSQSWCEYCKCDFDLLGYCQPERKPIQKLPDNSNQYYLCYEVNLLHIGADGKKKVCGMVEQACRYTFTCEDATHYSCDYLLNFVVSKTACIRCNSLSVYYDEKQQFCILLDADIKSCNLLNKEACLQMTKEIKCKWEDQECKQIDRITGSDSRDCSIYNQDACIQFQQDCWFDLNIGYCTQFDPTQGYCNLLLNEDLCLFSLKESCLWDSINQKCIKNDKEITQCSDLNKFGCLNQSIISCVWSDLLHQCQLINANNNAASCDSPLQNNQNSYVTHFSQKLCSQLKIQSSCFLDNYYQCRETIITDVIKCDTQGLNKFGCINRSIGQCQFIDEQVQCIENKNDQVGCLDSLNKWACISQKQTCKFDNNICSLHQVNTINDIINSTLKFAYSNSVCYSLDQKITDCLIYSEIQNRCINVSNRQPFIDNCYKFTTNKYACLQKTLQTCEYNQNENKCIQTSQSTLKTINNCFPEKDLNWVSCISLPSNCKFNGIKCQSIDLNIDTCESLSKSKFIVKASVCATTNDRKCKLNITSNTCEIVLETDNFQCSTPGLNRRTCLFQTKGYLCRFQDNQCIFDFGQAQCEDMINEDKCYSIKTKGQYCAFNSTKGCYSIDNTQGELLKCTHSFKTNPITCSKSTDIPCFYDKQNNSCTPFLDNKEQYQSLNLNWNNKISFNSLMCQRYSQDNIKVFWKAQVNEEECFEVQDAELKNLKCSNQLNENGCINIQTPYEYCQYENFICNSINIDNPKLNRNCTYYQKINSGALCQITTDNPCEYDWRNKRCQVLIEPFEVDCDNSTSNKWYNEAACMKNTNCIFQDGICQQKIDKSISFCQVPESKEIQLCQQITTQGCSVISDSCIALLPNIYQATKCKETVNKEGCILIQIPKSTCQYNQNKEKKCKIEDENFDFKQICLDMKSINYSQFCEQITDQSCKYNETTNKCEIATGNNYDCIRGLNEMACYNLTDKQQQCKYLNYCYGPNVKILGCNPNNQYDCCREAQTKESCLFQKQFQCQWQNGCQAYQQTSQDECNQIKDASVMVCQTRQESFCIFDAKNFNCKQITPESCDEIQTSYQCNKITDFPCLWDELNETCTYKEKDIFDQCNNISDNNGNLKACTMIERSGQKCIFQNNQCQTFIQKEGINNCINNINKESCLQQNVSPCEWVIKEVKVKKRKDITKLETIKIGECQQFTDFDKRECNLLLSYQSCISIKKLGQFCRWKNNKCQNFYLSDQLTSKNKLPELAQMVNPNVCGLYQDQRLIIYSQELASCIEVKDSTKLSCKQSKYGLNSISCFKIQSELCKWNHIDKTCEQVTIKNTNLTISCDLPGLNSKACTLIEINDSCGFIGNGCGKINLNVNCKHQGLNKFACLNILNYPCAWIKNDEDENYHCDDYQPYDTCNSINLQVNSMVCSSVQIDACYYNKQTQSCESPKENLDHCDIEGLNYIACSEVKGCYYDNHKCQTLKEQTYNCLKYPNAHQEICKNAYDLCKYSPLNYGCTPSQSNEICKREGLSQLGCVKSQNQCFWNRNNCECLSIQNVFPLCDQIVNSQKCKKFNYCFYDYQKTNNNEVNQQIENQNLGICRQKRCSDLNNQECQEFNTFDISCYLSNENQCKQANSCEEVKNSYDQCSSLTINGMPCIQGSDQKSCKKLVCSELDSVMCSKLSNYCIYGDYCQTKQCQELDLEEACRYHNCEWNVWTKQCKDKLKCESYETEQDCNQSTFNSIQCSWLTDNYQSFCVQNGCEYFSKIRGQSCTTQRVQNNFCVNLQDNTCLQCEEIKDSCLCIDQEYCSFNYTLSQCQSIKCNYLIEEECQQFDFCQFNFEKNSCHFNCAYYDNQLDCYKDFSNCYWDNEEKICTQSQVQINYPQPPNHIIVQREQLILVCILVVLLF